jgi:hypothetical protein
MSADLCLFYHCEEARNYNTERTMDITSPRTGPSLEQGSRGPKQMKTHWPLSVVFAGSMLYLFKSERQSFSKFDLKPI